MRQPLQLYRYINECLLRRESLSLATIISRSGSGLRETGASIVVTPDGKNLSTIGGRILEANVLEMAASVIRNRRGEYPTFFLTNDEVSADGYDLRRKIGNPGGYLDNADPLYHNIVETLLHYGKKGAGGLRRLLARYTQKSRNVLCNDPGILMDIDTPEDYERALKTFSE